MLESRVGCVSQSVTGQSACRPIYDREYNHRPWSVRGYTSALARAVRCLPSTSSLSSSWRRTPVVVAAGRSLHRRLLPRLSCWSVSSLGARHPSNWLRRLHPRRQRRFFAACRSSPVASPSTVVTGEGARRASLCSALCRYVVWMS